MAERLSFERGFARSERELQLLSAVNAGEKMHRRAGVKMHHGASSQRPVQLHILI
jgi:hypothetical protein